MATSTTRTNKPILPRGNDQSPKGYNRAELYTGKALDFDGVNDNVNLDGFTMAGDVATIVFYGQFDSTGYAIDINTQRFIIQNHNTFGFRVYNNNVWTAYGDTNRSELNFYAIVSDGTTQRAYYNGHQLGDDETVTALDWDSATQIKLGSDNAGSGSFLNGQLANFKIFNTALTAAQVADLYNNPEKVVPTGVDNTALKLWLPMMEGAGTKCLDGASLHTATERVENGDFSDGTTGWVGNPETTLSVTNGQLDIQSASGSGQYGAAFSEVNFTSGKYYLIQLDVISCDVPTQIRIGSAASATNYSTNIWSSGDIGIGSHSTIWYATTNDDYLSIGGRNDVTTLVIDNVSVKEISVGDISGATWTHGIGAPVAQTSVIDWNKRVLDKTNEFLIPQGLTSGRDLLGNLFENVRKQGALNLDGNSWAEVHDNGSLDITSAITLEAWVYLDSSPIDNVDSMSSIMTKKSANVTDSEAAFDVRATGSNGSIAITGGFDTGALQTINIATGLSIDQWYHIGITYDSGSVVTYLNGAQVNTGSMLSPIIANAYDVWIGRHVNAGGLNSYALADIAQPRIYNRALTAEEVQRNYNAGKNIYTND